MAVHIITVITLLLAASLMYVEMVTSYSTRLQFTRKSRAALKTKLTITFSSSRNIRSRLKCTERGEDVEDHEAAQGTEVVDDTAVDVAAELNSTVAVDPKAEAIKQAEQALQTQLDVLENTLRSERLMLSKIKNKVSESGKNGYFIVQAQVNEFLKRKDSEQKIRVSANKREFVNKMLPVVDAFREAPKISVAVTEKETKMHQNFGSLNNQILLAFEKFGYTEFSPGLIFF